MTCNIMCNIYIYMYITVYIRDLFMYSMVSMSFCSLLPGWRRKSSAS